MTRDTVAVETPASLATSLRVQDTMFSPGDISRTSLSHRGSNGMNLISLALGHKATPRESESDTEVVRLSGRLLLWHVTLSVLLRKLQRQNLVDVGNNLHRSLHPANVNCRQDVTPGSYCALVGFRICYEDPYFVLPWFDQLGDIQSIRPPHERACMFSVHEHIRYRADVPEVQQHPFAAVVLRKAKELGIDGCSREIGESGLR